MQYKRIQATFENSHVLTFLCICCSTSHIRKITRPSVSLYFFCSWQGKGELSHFVQQHHRHFWYMLYESQTNHTRQTKLRQNSNTGTRCSSLNFRALDLRRRPIAKCTPPSRPHSILAPQKIYQLCSKIHTALKTQTSPCTALVFFQTNQVHLRRRAIANCTPTSWAHSIHARQKIYHLGRRAIANFTPPSSPHSIHATQKTYHVCSKNHTAFKTHTSPSISLSSSTHTHSTSKHTRSPGQRRYRGFQNRTGPY